MTDYLERKVSKEELQVIFKRNIDRSIFIADYPYFNNDGNRDFYVDFICKNINNSKYKLQEDAIELSITIHNFNLMYLDTIGKIVYSRRGWWIKLLCLDWLYNFTDDIPLQTFYELNGYLTKSNNERLKIQGILNLLLLDKNNKLIKKLLILLHKSDDHIVFYRLINYENLTKIFTMTELKYVAEIIKTKTSLSSTQKSEITERLC